MTKRNACEPSFVATIWRSPVVTEIDRELGPPSASTIMSTDASLVAAITLTTSNRIPSRVQEPRADAVVRKKRTASTQHSGAIAERMEREASYNRHDELQLRLAAHLQQWTR